MIARRPAGTMTPARRNAESKSLSSAISRVPVVKPEESLWCLFRIAGGKHGKAMIESVADIARLVAKDGFALVRRPAMRGVLETAGLADWDGFAASWDDLGVDTYMADGGRYRRRRFAVFRATPEGVARKPHQPHYQSRDYNPLNGDIE